MKIILLSILLLSFQSLTFALDCGTPLECYTKAIETLQTDRNEMKQLMSQMKQENEQLRAQLTAKMDQTWITASETIFNNINSFTTDKVIKKINGVPETARKILVYTRYNLSAPCGNWSDFILTTTFKGKEFQKYLNYFPIPGTNSQIIEFDIGPNERFMSLNASGPMSCPPNVLQFYVELIGYKN